MFQCILSGPPMRLFACDHCGNTIYFENVVCEYCGHQLGYLPRHNALVALVEDGGLWSTRSFPDDSYVFCVNAKDGACNWLITAEPDGDIFCVACRHDLTIPPLDDPVSLKRWQAIQRAKKRLFYSLLRLGMPLETRGENHACGLGFRFPTGIPAKSDGVSGGHGSGVITIALTEADDVDGEARRAATEQPHRTMLERFRQEIGRYYWDLLIAGTPRLKRFAKAFGGAGQDRMLQTPHAPRSPQGPPRGQIRAYSTAHPRESFAESFAHYCHITDAVEVAAAFGVQSRPGRHGDKSAPAAPFDPYASGTIEQLLENWTSVTSLLDNFNWSMGHPDAFPFVLSPEVIERLGFIHELVHERPPQARADAVGNEG